MGLLGVYDYTVIMTYAGMLFSFTGIHILLSGKFLNYMPVIFCLMAAAVMDMFDGKVAGTKKNRDRFQKHFGIQIDSMCDLISYGVFPALFVFKIAENQFLSTFWIKFATWICAFYLLCALIRLSYFNVEEMDRQSKTEDIRHEYKGLPVTSIAAVLPGLFMVSFVFGGVCPKAVYCLVVLFVMGLLFISPIRIPKPEVKGKILLIILGICEFAILLLKRPY